MKSVDVEKLLELEANATAGPYVVEEDAGVIYVKRDGNFDWVIGHLQVSNVPEFRDNAKLIAATRNSIRELCLEVKALRDIAAQAQLESKSYPPSEPMSRYLDRLDLLYEGMRG